eukprot:5474221-Prymnesium_polylepis.1
MRVQAWLEAGGWAGRVRGHTRAIGRYEDGGGKGQSANDTVTRFHELYGRSSHEARWSRLRATA